MNEYTHLACTIDAPTSGDELLVYGLFIVATMVVLLFAIGKA